MATFSFWNVPFERRMQTLGALFWLLGSPPFAFIISITCTAFIAFFPVIGFPLLIVYLVWAYGYDNAPSKGGRPVRFFRSLKIWEYFRDYFPAQLVATEPLDPQGNYLFCYHPHGILSIGALFAFGLDVLGFSKIFPGVDVRLMTLKMNFGLPFYREYMLAYGLAEVSYESCVYNLTAGPGRSIAIVIGGASEALESHPGTMSLTLKKRKGFVRVAAAAGASIVPVIGFGENDLFDSVPNPHGSVLRRFQEKMLKVFGYSMPLFHGRGIFNYAFGLLPHRRPLTIVTGRPIKVPMNPNISQEEIDRIHGEYMGALQRLYDENKNKYDKHRQKEMEIIL